MTSRFTRREFLQSSGRWVLGAGVLSAAPAFLSGCASMGDVAAIGSSLAAGAGIIDSSSAESITKSAKAVAKTFEEITPEQEYYIGRAVAAAVLARYAPTNQKGATSYINVLGQGLVQVSDRPETYGGYHFLILDSEDINALSAPSGFIFITRGLMKCCQHETALASVLAQEIGHVQHKHGLQAIQKARVTTALTTIGVESAKTLGGEALANLTSVFEDSINDITHTLIDNGYSRSLEYEADRTAVAIMSRLGYDPNGLIDMLQVMDTRLKPGGLDFAKTHPAPKQRIKEVKDAVKPIQAVQENPLRRGRFDKVMKSI